MSLIKVCIRMVRRWKMLKASNSWKLVSRLDSKSEVQTIIDSRLVKHPSSIVMELDSMDREVKKVRFGRTIQGNSTTMIMIRGNFNPGVALVQSKTSLVRTGKASTQMETKRESWLVVISNESKANTTKAEFRILSVLMRGNLTSLVACIGQKLKATFDLRWQIPSSLWVSRFDLIIW